MAMAAAAARRLLRLLSSRPNPKPASLSSCSSAGEREGDPLSWRLLRLRSPGAAAAAIDRWAQERGRVSRPDLQRAVSQLRRYGHALKVSGFNHQSLL
ncbi:pentatricopeptide repeat-containing protein [Hordeum vulgare]|nr:pentatricopeptide repeat-containing protein [Hordeum vulgare]